MVVFVNQLLDYFRLWFCESTILDQIIPYLTLIDERSDQIGAIKSNQMIVVDRQR